MALGYQFDPRAASCGLVGLGGFCADTLSPRNGGVLASFSLCRSCFSSPAAAGAFRTVLCAGVTGRSCLLPDCKETMLMFCVVVLVQRLLGFKSPPPSSRVRGKQMQREIKRLKTSSMGHPGPASATTARCGLARLRGQDVRSSLTPRCQICRRGCAPCRPSPVCGQEPGAQRPQQHGRWSDEPGGALCARLQTKRINSSRYRHALGKRMK